MYATLNTKFLQTNVTRKAEMEFAYWKKIMKHVNHTLNVKEKEGNVVMPTVAMKNTLKPY